MRIGVPRETKPLEGRVALTPVACAELIRHGHDVLVEHDAGVNSGHPAQAYAQAGASLCADAAGLYAQATLIVKVKEPTAADLSHLKAHHVLFCYLHLAANPELAFRLRDLGLTALAFETVQVGDDLPLLAPMSEIAGRLAVQVGTHLLHQPQGGCGVMLGGLAGVERGHVMVIGAGAAGGAAVEAAAAQGARVTVFDLKPERLARMRALAPNVMALYAFSDDMNTTLMRADLLVGAVLRPGKRAPHVVTREMVRRMPDCSVIVDISVDQGGCVETTRPMTYADPIYIEEGVLHFTVTNMPGAVPKTASQALAGALVPYILRLAQPGWDQDPALRMGLNVRAGQFEHAAVREELSHS